MKKEAFRACVSACSANTPAAFGQPQGNKLIKLELLIRVIVSILGNAFSVNLQNTDKRQRCGMATTKIISKSKDATRTERFIREAGV